VRYCAETALAANQSDMPSNSAHASRTSMRQRDGCVSEADVAGEAGDASARESEPKGVVTAAAAAGIFGGAMWDEGGQPRLRPQSRRWLSPEPRAGTSRARAMWERCGSDVGAMPRLGALDCRILRYVTTATITPDDFFAADLRVGRVVSAEPFPEARKPAIKLRIDFGELGVRRSSAQLTVHYTPEELVGRLVVAVVNFPPRQIGPFISEVLVLGACTSPSDVVLLAPDVDVPLGTRIL
jgi:tRNA-binding protein